MVGVRLSFLLFTQMSTSINDEHQGRSHVQSIFEQVSFRIVFYYLFVDIECPASAPTEEQAFAREYSNLTK